MELNTSKMQKKSIEILKIGLKQRKLLLKQIENRISVLQNQSDYGWLLTLGAQEFGMLTAITSAKQVRELKTVRNKLIEEINIIKSAINS